MSPDLTPEHFMRLALNQALIARAQGDAPIGAIVVQNGAVIGRGRNQREEWNDPTAHAEMLALQDAAEQIGQWRLDGCDLYCTLEPCIMCAGGIQQARIARLYYAASDPKCGGVESLYQILEDGRLNHQTQIFPGVLQDECEAVLKDFFAGLR
ncbi:MAG: nucleoside deaminase [Candidatus Hinthialibacter antarcticus]|nr:nucleoside deaminase [Candidatus Hinthialibacter antarcticus]